MTSRLATSVDFTLPFYRSRVVVATRRRHGDTGWSSSRRHWLVVGGRHDDTGWWSSRLGRPLTTAVWLAAAGVVVGVGLIICVVSWSSHILDDDQQTSVSDAAPPSAASTARRRRLKNTLRPRE